MTLPVHRLINTKFNMQTSDREGQNENELNQNNETGSKLEKAKTAKTNKPSIEANKRKPNKTKTKKQNDNK